MKRITLTILMLAGLIAPALSHPGSAHDHANLSAFQHAIVTALPVVAALIVVALAAALYLRKA